jgi:hypothetical protein
MPEATPAVSDASIAAFIGRWSAAHSTERAKAVESALTAAEHPVTATTLAQQFTRVKEAEVQEILETLAALGRAQTGDTQGTFVR